MESQSNELAMIENLKKYCLRKKIEIPWKNEILFYKPKYCISI